MHATASAGGDALLVNQALTCMMHTPRVPVIASQVLKLLTALQACDLLRYLNLRAEEGAIGFA
eukprot:9300115-Alexandrium_andersonii.AAC.1